MSVDGEVKVDTEELEEQLLIKSRDKQPIGSVRRALIDFHFAVRDLQKSLKANKYIVANILFSSLMSNLVNKLLPILTAEEKVREAMEKRG